MVNNSFKENKDCAKKILKKVHRISDKTLIVIDQTLVEQLSLEVGDIWFEQELTGNGILLKIWRNGCNGIIKERQQ